MMSSTHWFLLQPMENYLKGLFFNWCFLGLFRKVQSKTVTLVKHVERILTQGKLNL